MIGYSLRTSAAASRPIFTSSAGEYLFFGATIFVCVHTDELDVTKKRMATPIAVRFRRIWAGIGSSGAVPNRTFARSCRSAPCVTARNLPLLSAQRSCGIDGGGAAGGDDSGHDRCHHEHT